MPQVSGKTLIDNMRGIEIHDMHPRGFLAFDLKDILRCLGSEALDRHWKCRGVECTGEATADLEALDASGEAIAGTQLAALAERTNQVIWGDFFGHYPGETADSLCVKAIDSSLWQVYGDDACLEKIRTGFKDVRPAKADAG